MPHDACATSSSGRHDHIQVTTFVTPLPPTMVGEGRAHRRNRSYARARARACVRVTDMLRSYVKVARLPPMKRKCSDRTESPELQVSVVRFRSAALRRDCIANRRAVPTHPSMRAASRSRFSLHLAHPASQPKRIKQLDDTHNIKLSFRQTKCTVIAELLYELWDLQPEEYILEPRLNEKWEESVVPLIKLGLPPHLSKGDLWHIMNS